MIMISSLLLHEAKTCVNEKKMNDSDDDFGDDRDNLPILIQATPANPVRPPPDEQPPLRTTPRPWSGPQWIDCRDASCLRT